jgi:multisubunit Na+/H+ antiporter MnhC subunit
MSDVSGHEADHASDTASHGHVPVDPNDGVVRATAPSPRALLVTVIAVALTVLALVAIAVASGQGA